MASAPRPGRRRRTARRSASPWARHKRAGAETMTLAPFARRIGTPFAVNPLSGRLSEEMDYDAYISSLIRHLLLTTPGERISRPPLGAGIRRLGFAPLSDATAITGCSQRV